MNTQYTEKKGDKIFRRLFDWRKICPKPLFWVIRITIHRIRNIRNTRKLIVMEHTEFRSVIDELSTRDLCPKLMEFIREKARSNTKRWLPIFIVPRTHKNVAVVLMAKPSGLVSFDTVISIYFDGEVMEEVFEVKDSKVPKERFPLITLTRAIVTGFEVAVMIRDGSLDNQEYVMTFDFTHKPARVKR